jgi:hypothetical protein
VTAGTPEELEQAIRDALRKRDAARRARLGDELAKQAADDEFVATAMEAAGYGPPDEETEKVTRRARRRGRANEDRAFGEAM